MSQRCPLLAANIELEEQLVLVDAPIYLSPLKSGSVMTEKKLYIKNVLKIAVIYKISAYLYLISCQNPGLKCLGYGVPCLVSYLRTKSVIYIAERYLSVNVCHTKFYRHVCFCLHDGGQHLNLCTHACMAISV